MPRSTAAHLTHIKHALKIAIYISNLDIKVNDRRFSLLSLYILYNIKREGQLTRTEIGRWLRRCKMPIHHKYVGDQTNILLSLGFVIRQEITIKRKKAFRYSISALGTKFLIDIEEATRKQQMPKHSLMKRASELSLGYYHRNREKINEKRRKKPPTP
jgi:hypothetical protein